MACMVIGPVTNFLETMLEFLARRARVKSRDVIDLKTFSIPGKVEIQLKRTDALHIELVVESGMAVIPTLMKQHAWFLVVTVMRPFDLNLIETQAVV